MKKIFTLIAATFLTVASFAADRKPVVTVTGSSNYQIVIDGQSYSGSSTMSLSNLYNGQHSIKVFQAGRGLFSKKRKLVSTSSFQLKGNDLDICLDFRGQISITEKKPAYNKWDDARGWDSHSKDHNNDKYDRNRHF
jgi:hypothetical protein